MSLNKPITCLSSAQYCRLAFTLACTSCEHNTSNGRINVSNVMDEPKIEFPLCPGSYTTNNQDLKKDSGKIRWDLVEFSALDGIARVLEFGASKYTEGGWKDVESKRYKAALLRHIFAYLEGEEVDEESGLDHLDHAQTNLMFLKWFKNEESK